MLPITRRPLKNLEEENMKKSTFASHANSGKNSVAVGLRILIQISQCETNIVVKPAIRLSKPTSKRHSFPASSLDSCFLKACYLCHKKLRPDKDIYMYRGDQGFCSVECRSRQIVLDEKKEIETSTKQMLASSRRSYYNGRCETRVLKEGFQWRHEPPSRHKNQAIFS